MFGSMTFGSVPFGSLTPNSSNTPSSIQMFIESQYSGSGESLSGYGTMADVIFLGSLGDSRMFGQGQ